MVRLIVRIQYDQILNDPRYRHNIIKKEDMLDT